MKSWFANSKPRMAAAAVVAVACLALLLTIGPAKSAASQLLGVFRVEKFTTITVDPATMKQGEQGALAHKATGEGAGTMGMPDVGKISFTGMPSFGPVATVDEAAAAIGVPLSLPSALPTGLDKPNSINVSKPLTVKYQVDLAKLRAFLAKQQVNVALPDSLDGATITVDVPGAAFVEYGTRPAKDAANAPFLAVVELKSPTLTVPDGIDVNALRDQILSSGMIPAQIADQLRAITDWQSTIPVPAIEGKSKAVTLKNGASGVLMGDGQHGAVVAWITGSGENSVIHALGGTVSEDAVLAAANSIE